MEQSINFFMKNIYYDRLVLQNFKIIFLQNENFFGGMKFRIEKTYFRQEPDNPWHR